MPKTTPPKPLRLLFVINPISGDRDKEDLELKIRQLARRLQFKPDLFYTTGEQDEKKLHNEIDHLAPDRVLAVGGDGTCNLVARVLLDCELPLAIIPMGSANGMARELEIPEEIDKAIELAVCGKVDLLDVLRVNGEYISLHLSDIGINATVVERFEKEKIRGMWGYARQYAKALMDAKPIRFQLTIDGKKIRKRAYMVVIANASKYGTGANINPEGRLNDGKFEVVLLRPYSFFHLFGMVVSFFTGQLHTLEYIDVYPCRKLHIQNSREHVVQVDGEFIGRLTEVDVEILPRNLQVVIPSTSVD